MARRCTSLCSPLPLSGQPGIWDCEPGQKHVMYVAVTADGTCLPPVIFLKQTDKLSTDPTGCITDEEGNVGYVLYIANFKGPSERSTQAWLDTLQDYFGDEPHVILDALGGHFAPGITQDWKNVGATLHKIPGGAGKWLNPCDQAINREIRREFIRLQSRNRENKVRNLIRAYYSLKDTTIINSFKKCGVFGGDPDDIITEQACKGYRASGARGVENSGLQSRVYALGVSIRPSP